MPQPVSLRLGTRGSPLALAQADMVAGGLRSAGISVELVVVRTQGDLGLATTTDLDSVGLFTKALQDKLRTG
ncbi:MAG TPA: hypothetical protein VIY86_11745, partial [Pirellulaceae bacterium]